MTERRIPFMASAAGGRTLAISVAFAALSIALKLAIVRYGLPHEFNADESYILKDPFKLASMYAAGNFSLPTNLYFWLLQVWFAGVFVAGRVMTAWHSLGDFRALLVAESPTLILAGRMLSVLCSGVAIWILAIVAARTIADIRLRWLLVATLAVNPLDLVSAGWLKFDGPAMLLNAIFLALAVRYLETQSAAARRRVYVFAFVSCAYRTDFFVLLIALVLYDAWTHASFKPVRGAIGVGLIAYSLLTLMPISRLYVRLAPPTTQTVAVANSFEQNIGRRFSEITPAALARIAASNAAFYGGLSLALGPVLLAGLLGLIRRHAPTVLALLIAVGLLGPTLLYPANGTRYALLPSVYLLFAAGWMLQTVRSDVWRRGWMAAAVVFAASLSVEAVMALRTDEDTRVAAGQYLLAHSTSADVIAIENYMNPGVHAEFDECPDQLAAKADAVKTLNLGTGETLRSRSMLHPTDCRRVLEVAETDRFGGSPDAGRWVNVYDANSLPAWFTSNARYDLRGAPRVTFATDAFAHTVADRYVLAAAFEPHHADPRLDILLSGTAYSMPVYVYRRTN